MSAKPSLAIRSGRKARVMIVDDAEDNRAIVSRFLTRAGCDTMLCPGGVEALASLAEYAPDLILLDWMMPELSGIDVLRAIRERYDANRLPVIMCTARDESESVVITLEAGANDYLPKPMNMTVAFARIAAQLDRKCAMEDLAAVNADLERLVAERTRVLLNRGATPEQAQPAQHSAAAEPGRKAAMDEILRLADWLRRNEQADDRALRAVCAESIAAAARRLA